MTLSAAKSTCASNSNCEGVYDRDCDNDWPFLLCLKRVDQTYGTSSSSCIYEKNNGMKNWNQIYKIEDFIIVFSKVD